MPDPDRTPAGNPVLTAFAGLGLAMLILAGLLLARAVLVPLAFALLAALMIGAAVSWLGRLPGAERTPLWLRHLVILLMVTLAVAALFVQIRVSAEVLVARLPTYQANIVAALQGIDAQLGLGDEGAASLSMLLGDLPNLQAVARSVLGTLGSFGGVLLVVVFYAAFLLIEERGFVRRLHIALPGPGQADRVIGLVQAVTARIGGFLAVKTLINLILGVASWFAMVAMGVDLAGFWAILIGVLNYIPYLGSVVGVAFPALTVLAQTGSVQTAVVATVILTIIQSVIASVVEPRLIGARINLSPFVILVALAVWSWLWGLAGAVLAIPMTVLAQAMLAAFPSTRPVAVLLSHNGRV